MSRNAFKVLEDKIIEDKKKVLSREHVIIMNYKSQFCADWLNWRLLLE